MRTSPQVASSTAVFTRTLKYQSSSWSVHSLDAAVPFRSRSATGATFSLYSLRDGSAYLILVLLENITHSPDRRRA